MPSETAIDCFAKFVAALKSIDDTIHDYRLQCGEQGSVLGGENVAAIIKEVVEYMVTAIASSRSSISGFVIFDPKNVEEGDFAQAALNSFLLDKENLNFTPRFAVYEGVLSFGVGYAKFANARLQLLSSENSKSKMQPLCITYKDKSTTPPTLGKIQTAMEKTHHGAIFKDDIATYSVVNPNACKIEFFFRFAHNDGTKENDGRFGSFFLVS